MYGFIMLLALFTVSSLPLQADDGLVVVQSSHGVAETMDRFEKAAREAGMGVFARIDHAKGAAKAGMELPPTELIIFGNPKIGTRLMQSNRLIGIDLPLKALVWQDENGVVWLGYSSPDDLLGRYGIEELPELQNKMTGALGKFAAAATSP
jgi:uncharacterized protein (DUF302 family)